MIGIVGGVGPHAGLDLMKKVFDNSQAASDQEHVDALLFSLPSGINDRTEYLLGKVEENPGKALAEILIRLEKLLLPLLAAIVIYICFAYILRIPLLLQVINKFKRG